MPKRAYLAMLVVLLLPATLSAQLEDRLTLDLYLELERVSNPRISPDGTQIIYTRQWIDKVNDSRESSLWIMNADGSRNRFLIDGSNARWSPDGERIAFTAPGEPRGSQIFVRWMDAEGAVTQITHVDKGPGSIKWSPDGNHIGFTMLVDEKQSWSIDMPDRPEGADWTAAPKIVTRLAYRRDRQGFTDTGYRHIFVVPSSGGTPRQITRGSYNHSSVEWTPDGRSILFSGLREDEAEYQWRESHIYSVDVATREVRQVTDHHGPDSGPVVSPDGSRIVYAGYDWTEDTFVERKLYVVELDGRNGRLASGNWDRSPSNITWNASSDGVYFTASDSGTRNLYFLPLEGDGAGVVRPVSTGTQMLTTTDIHPSGMAVGTLTSFHSPADVVIFDVDDPSSLKQLTAVNEDILADKKLGEVHEITYTSTDELEIQGWYITPPDFDPNRRYPLQLHIHGGPHGMYNVGFNFGWQEQAANDYVILYTNPRGSSGYGSEFGNEIMRAYPSKDYDDLMAGVDALLEEGFVDSDNMFVTGCSGGGVLTAWVVGHTDRFAAASANCPVIDWVSFVGTTDGASWYRNFDELPWVDPSEHIRRSPLTYVGNVTTPTMLMTGVNDLRTPMPQTEQFYSALRYLKVPAAMVRFNDEWHGTTSNPSNFMRTQLYLRYWFEKYRTDTPSTDVQNQ